MLRVSNLVVQYGAVAAVDGFSFDVSGGEIVALIGANGAGKSSVLKAVLGLVHAKGQISLDGSSLTDCPTHARVQAGIALSPEGRQVFPEMTALENLGIGFRPRSGVEERRLIEEMVTMFPRLGERLNQAAGRMSGGEQQMLAIARALMSTPKLLMLDEPTLGLAPLVVEQLRGILIKLRHRGLAILLAEQNAEMALETSDRAYVLETGRVALEGRSSVLATDDAVQRAYLGIDPEAVAFQRTEGSVS